MTSTARQIRPHHAVTLVVITYLCVRAFWWASARVWHWTDLASAEALAKLALWMPACVAAAWLLRSTQSRSVWSDLGLSSGAARGFVFGVAATVPMAIAVAFLPQRTVEADLIAASGILSPFAEELLFRGFLFTLLVSRAGWSVPSALLLSSILFGFAHVPNVDTDLWTIVRGPDPQRFEFGYWSKDGTLSHFTSGADVWWRHVTTTVPRLLAHGLPQIAGGAVFAWITSRWKSLWPAIALHGFLNFWWDMTQGEHARMVFRLDPLTAAQALSIALAIWMTIRWSGGNSSPATFPQPGPTSAQIDR